MKSIVHLGVRAGGGNRFDMKPLRGAVAAALVEYESGK